MTTVTDLGQVNGMAWARSAHSSFTGSPLAELQEWQGGSKAPLPDSKPVRIEATTGQGWKTSYGYGEKLSLDGLTLTIVYSDGSKRSFTKPFDKKYFTFEPAECSEIWLPNPIVCEYHYGDSWLDSVSTSIYFKFTGKVLNDISVSGPTRKVYAIGEKLSLEGLVVKAQWQQPDGSLEWSPVPEKIGEVTDGYTMKLDAREFTSNTIPAGEYIAGKREFEVRYHDFSHYDNLTWFPAITTITRPTDSFSPDWGPQQEIPLTSLPAVNATLYSGEVKEGLSLNSLLSLAEPWLIFVEARYTGLEHNVVINAGSDRALKGIVEDHTIAGYRYLYGPYNEFNSEPVSEWLSITPPPHR